MILLPGTRSTARGPYLLLLLLLVVFMISQLSAAQDVTDGTTVDTPSDTTSDETTTDGTTTDTTPDTVGDSTTPDESTTPSASSEASSNDNYPVVTPPPLDDAPYMQKSATPEGTVFIAVGAVLGAMGLSVLAWRGMVAWSVNRSVRQAAVKHSSESKGLLRSKRRKSRSHGHGHGHGHHPAVSLEKLSSNRRSAYRDSRASKIPTSGSGLFFSPTAGMNNSGNRGSNYLPAGYYAAGSAASQSGPFSSDHLPGLGPQARGYTRTGSGPTPPQSPMVPPVGGHEPQYSHLRQSYAAASTSSLNLASPPPNGRTPSAYLEDLFENHAPQGRHH